MKKRLSTKASPEVMEFLSRGVAEIIGRKELVSRLTHGPRLTVYYGVDPSGAKIHLGHAVILRKLRTLQNMGHQIILLIGDFTGRIGDPTDRSAARQPLTHEQVLQNAADYQKQASKILDFQDPKNPALLRYNAEWLDGLTFRELISLASHFTVQQFLERDMYQDRLKAGKPIHLHEFLYPLMQGYDSVAMGVDMELGGSDQLFNMLAGRTLVRELLDKEKIVMTLELLEGTDGRKMSKSFANDVAITDSPSDMYGKIMSMRDEVMWRYWTLCTKLPLSDIARMKREVTKGKQHPREIKSQLAKNIVAQYHSKDDAERAAEEFDKVFQRHGRPENMPTYSNTEKRPLLDICVDAGLLSSKSEVRRMIAQGGIKINEKKVASTDVVPKKGDVIQVGKRKFLQIR